VSQPSRGGEALTGLPRLQQMHFSFASERVLSVSLQFDLFSHIAAGRKTAGEIAAAAGASERGTKMLLDALAGFELLSKRDGRYELTPDATRYLVRESPEYVGSFFGSDRLYEAWGHLADAVREGKPYRSSTRQDVAEDFFPVLIRTLHITNGEPARNLAAQVVAGGAKKGLRVLDIGCGSGVWSIAVAKADPEARITELDFPKVLETTRKFVEREGVVDRAEFLAGDLRSAQLPEQSFDLAILGNIVHGLGVAESRDLFARIHGALDTGGRMAIVDMMPNDERSGPLFPLVFALNMLVNTDEGSTYTLAEYREWLTAAGYASVETLDIGLHSPAIVATKG
jgi:SAM-dependent methyltransferase